MSLHAASVSTTPPAIPTNPLDFSPGSPERAALSQALERMTSERPEIPCYIGGKEVFTGRRVPAVMPHNHQHVLADVHWGGQREVMLAIEAAAAAWPWWSKLSWEERSAPFLRAADMLQFGPWRHRLNAATMLDLSKTCYQADIDAACETVDFLRFNVRYMRQIYAMQPNSTSGTWNRADYRPLEGFVLAISPFNFTCMVNLAVAPAIMGNTVVWKPAETAGFVAHQTMTLLREAGLPDGVINVVYGDGPEIATPALNHSALAGVNFTGSTAVFKSIWRTVGTNVDRYRNYPRLVGETGGKDFIVAHTSADVDALSTAIIRGSFEYQGQKCSSASRLFVPESLWSKLRQRLEMDISQLRVGDPADFSIFLGAVIDGDSFARQKRAFEEARSEAEIIVGGGCSDEIGWFVEPTVIRTNDPAFRLLREELFGPIMTAFVYPDRDWLSTLRFIDQSTMYGLTGAVFADDRHALSQADEELRYAAGNLYFNDKPTGSVVSLQPFGGARASGTNDKAGSIWSLTRWMSPRVTKENFVPPRQWGYPYQEPDLKEPVD